MNEKQKKNRIGITWKMFAILILFVTVVVLITWFFQLQSLTYFYQLTKFEELRVFSDEIVEAIPALSEKREDIEEHSQEYLIDVWIIEVKDGRGLIRFRSSGSGANLKFDTDKLGVLYTQAQKVGGTYMAIAPYDRVREEFSLEIIEDNADGDEDRYPIVMKNTDDICAIYATLCQIDGREYMAVQLANMTPLAAMVGALRYQLTFCMFLVFVLALITAVIMSRLITKPFVRMNEAAKRLAEGKYDADFSGQGYREINELADTLNFASMELSKNDSLQKELISNISHDLRTPLTMIRGYSEMMRDIPDENTPENVQVIIDETTRLSELVTDMLDLSKIRSGTRKPDMEIFSLTDTVQDTLRRYEKLMKQEGYKIEFKACGDVHVRADKGMILQVIYNLINNAVNYTGEDRYVCVTESVTEGRVRISVNDTGEGIDSADIPYIFDRYYRVDRVHKRAAIGTGLGLSIVKGVLEVHGASYGVESAKNCGSTFWFELDRVETEIPNFDDTGAFIDTDYVE